jgi:hypothetical protein
VLKGFIGRGEGSRGGGRVGIQRISGVIEQSSLWAEGREMRSRRGGRRERRMVKQEQGGREGGKGAEWR